jgi:hypothetical protein
MSKRIAALVVAVLALVAITAGLASASSLTVRGGVLTTATATRPCADGATATGPTTTTANQTGVRITVPASCVGRTVQATVVDAAGVAHSSAPTVMTAATLTLPVSGYVGTSSLVVRATVDGWNLTTTWSYTPPLPMASCRVIATGATCTADVTLARRSVLFFGTFDYYDVQVSGNAGLAWEITLNLDHPGYGSVPTRLGNSVLDSDAQVTRVGALCVSGPPRLTVRAETGVPTSFSLIANSSSFVVTNNLRSCP